MNKVIVVRHWVHNMHCISILTIANGMGPAGKSAEDGDADKIYRELSSCLSLACDNYNQKLFYKK